MDVFVGPFTLKVDSVHSPCLPFLSDVFRCCSFLLLCTATSQVNCRSRSLWCWIRSTFVPHRSYWHGSTTCAIVFLTCSACASPHTRDHLTAPVSAHHISTKTNFCCSNILMERFSQPWYIHSSYFSVFVSSISLQCFRKSEWGERVGGARQEDQSTSWRRVGRSRQEKVRHAHHVTAIKSSRDLWLWC